MTYITNPTQSTNLTAAEMATLKTKLAGKEDGLRFASEIASKEYNRLLILACDETLAASVVGSLLDRADEARHIMEMLIEKKNNLAPYID